MPQKRANLAAKPVTPKPAVKSTAIKRDVDSGEKATPKAGKSTKGTTIFIAPFSMFFCSAGSFYGNHPFSIKNGVKT
jgi:hypothetical protein